MQCTLNGVLIVDKPESMTSARLVSKIKRWTHAKKVGHTGVLDPFATGVMICCLNQATRISQFFLNGDKAYEAVLHLGIETDTQDYTGTIISENKTDELTKSDVEKAIHKFKGPLEQLPPVYSALKHNGTPLYKLARRGIPFQKPARKITIYDIKVISVNIPEVRIWVSCSKGTYIRALCSDIGKVLNCGAHLKGLKRVSSCGFSIDQTLSLTELELSASENSLEKSIIPMADALKNIPECVVDDQISEKIRFGKTIFKSEIESPYNDAENDDNRPVKILDAKRQLLAILTDKKLNPQYNYCCVFNNDNAK